MDGVRISKEDCILTCDLREQFNHYKLYLQAIAILYVVFKHLWEEALSKRFTKIASETI